MTIISHYIPLKQSGPTADENHMEASMQNNHDPNDTAGFSFQVDLLNLNLHLAETEKSPEPQSTANEMALAQMRTLGSRA
ncbi:MAG: hypothetical protein ACKV2U_05755 [Bryobacteraceae bacterium]